MTIKDILAEKDFRMDDVPGGVADAATKAQKLALKEVTKLLNSLDTENGVILLTEKNLALIEQIGLKVQDSIFESEYIIEIRNYAQGIADQSKLTNEYFKLAFPELFDDEDKIFKALVRETQRKALEMLAADSVQAVFTNPLKNIILDSVSNKAGFAETVQTLTTFIEGNKELDGKLLRYVKQVAYDGFAVADRNYTHAIAEKIGAEWYRYVGGKISDTREFCLQRNGKYFHKSEVEAWAKLSWQGKNSSSNSSTIFSFAGGWNCKHSILPVSEASVPEEVKKRVGGANNASGFVAAKDLKEAEEYASRTFKLKGYEKYGIKVKPVDYSKYSVELSNNINKKITELDKKYGAKLNSINPNLQASIAATANGEAHVLTRELRYSTKLNNVEEYIKKTAQGVENNKFVYIDKENYQYRTITHEYGHLVATPGRLKQLATTDPIYKEARKDWNALTLEYLKKATPQEKKILGAYSDVNEDEFFAEAFTNYELAKEKSPWAVKVMDWYKKHEAANKKLGGK